MKKKAFEVEEIKTRKNYSFVLDGDYVYMHDTSRGSDNRILTTMPGDSADGNDFPFGATTSKEYFDMMYKKSLKENWDAIYFIGWVDPETFEPLEIN